MKKIISLLFFVAFAFYSNVNAQQYRKLLDFDGINGKMPSGNLISDGVYLYGTTLFGGVNNAGNIFKIKPDGTGFINLFDFNGINGQNPSGASLLNDGQYLYGMTFYGGTNGIGTIFKIKPDGSGFTTLFNFDDTNGSRPNGGLISDGTYLYGTTVFGGAGNGGIIFKIKPDGSGFTNIHNCNSNNNGNEVLPPGSFVSDGIYLYGMSSGATGGGYQGAIFKIKPDGTNFTNLHNFNQQYGGSEPSGDLLSDGTYLYGMTVSGGTSGRGIIFKIKPDGTSLTTLFNFNVTNGAWPYGSLISDSNYLYGMTNLGGVGDKGVIFKIKPDGTGFSVLFNFNNNGTDGAQPRGSLIRDSIHLYGMTSVGGINDYGVIFKLNLTCRDTVINNMQTINHGESYVIGSYTYTAAGTYTNTFPLKTGCDSVIVTNLIVIADTTTTGINELKDENLKLRVYPNPTGEILNIDISASLNVAGTIHEKQIEIYVYDVLGREIIQSSTLNAQHSSINVSSLPKGIYFVKVGGEARKFVKE